MEDRLLIDVAAAIATGLLAIIAYFLRSIHTDFKQFREEVTEIKILAMNLDTRTHDLSVSQDQKHHVIDTRLNNHSAKLQEHDKEIAVLKVKK